MIFDVLVDGLAWTTEQCLERGVFCGALTETEQEVQDGLDHDRARGEISPPEVPDVARDGRGFVSDLSLAHLRQCFGDLFPGDGARPRERIILSSVPGWVDEDRRGDLGDIARIDPVDGHSGACWDVDAVILDDVSSVGRFEVLREEAGPKVRVGISALAQVIFYLAVRDELVFSCSRDGQKDDVLDATVPRGVDERDDVVLDIRDGGGTHQEHVIDPFSGRLPRLGIEQIEVARGDALAAMRVTSIRAMRGSEDRCSALEQMLHDMCSNITRRACNQNLAHLRANLRHVVAFENAGSSPATIISTNSASSPGEYSEPPR